MVAAWQINSEESLALGCDSCWDTLQRSVTGMAGASRAGVKLSLHMAVTPAGSIITAQLRLRPGSV